MSSSKLMSSMNEEYLTFEDNELLTFVEMNDFLKTSNPLCKARIIADKLIERILINHSDMYLYIATSVTYKRVTSKSDKLLHDYLLMISRILITTSF